MAHKCYKCGAELPEREPGSSLAKIICPKCGAKNMIGMEISRTVEEARKK